MTNDGEIEARSDAKTTSIAVSVAVNGVAGSVATSTATAVSAAIDGGADNDVIVNRVGDEPSRTGTLTADAVAFATAATVGVVANGVAVGADSFWDGEPPPTPRRPASAPVPESTPSRIRNDQLELRRENGVGRGQRRRDRRRRGRGGRIDVAVDSGRYRCEQYPAGFNHQCRPSGRDIGRARRVGRDRVQYQRRGVCRNAGLEWRDAR